VRATKRPRHVRFGSILLKKSFLANERKFFSPAGAFKRGNVRDHIDSRKCDHRPSYLPSDSTIEKDEGATRPQA
jgi:hypothetical protein